MAAVVFMSLGRGLPDAVFLKYVTSILQDSAATPNCCSPTNHETLTRCWFNAGPVSVTPAQYRTNTVSLSRAPCVVLQYGRPNGVHFVSGWKRRFAPTPHNDEVH